MSQLMSRKKALRCLSQHTSARTERQEGEDFSPAEILMLDALALMESYLFRFGGPGLVSRDEKFYKRLKFIARSLSLYPIPEGIEKSKLVRERMGAPTGNIEITGGRRSQHRIVEISCRDSSNNKGST